MKKVLIVDDSLTIRQMVTAALAPDGIETLEAIDGWDAIAKLSAASDVALVICDVNMPRMNGLDLVENVRGRGSKVPFVMLSADGKPELMERARRLGVTGWIVKPVKPSPLANAVRSLLGSSRTPR